MGPHIVHDRRTVLEEGPGRASEVSTRTQRKKRLEWAKSVIKPRPQQEVCLASKAVRMVVGQFDCNKEVGAVVRNAVTG